MLLKCGKGVPKTSSATFFSNQNFDFFCFEQKVENFAPFLILALFQNSISCLFIAPRNQPASKSLFISLNQKFETF